MKHYTRIAIFTVLGFAACSGLVGLVYSYIWIPYSDNYVLTHADPAMVKLADEAGMSRKGKLVFLRTDPELVSDSQMRSTCADNTAANNSNGFIEQGCYNTDTHRIYIRKMPDNLHGLVVATASYEMLHPVYITLQEAGEEKTLDAAIEANYRALNDAHLKEQAANFAKTEPGARDLELFSLLGAGYTNLSTDLAAYYAPYFDDLAKTVAANNQAAKLFEASQKQLTTVKSQIDYYDNLASQAYDSSASWARTGNQYWDDYYYRLYKRYVQQENDAIDQYNILLKSYNALVTEYNGTQPVKEIGPAQAQSE